MSERNAKLINKYAVAVAKEVASNRNVPEKQYPTLLRRVKKDIVKMWYGLTHKQRGVMRRRITSDTLTLNSLNR